MQKYLTRPAGAGAAVIALGGASVILAGCQSYQPTPLDLVAHRDAWQARSPGDEPVRAFAESLDQSREPGVYDPSDGLSLAEGEVMALVYNPKLRLARLRAGVAFATAEHAGLWQDPQLGVDFLTLLEGGSNPFVITPGLAFTIPISGRLEAEKARAHASARAELTRVAEQEWQTRLDVRRAWLGWSASRLKAGRTEKLLESIRSLESSATSLAEAGEILRTEAALFTIELAAQRRALLMYKGDEAQAEQELRALLGVSPDAPLELVPSVVFDADAGDFTPEHAATQSLTLAVLRDEYEVAEQTLRREVRKQYPDLTIGPLAEFDRSDTLLGFALSLPIPVLNANRQGIAEAHAERELARASFETAYEQLVGSLASTHAHLSLLRQQREMIESDIVPLVDRQLADAQNLLQLGEGGSLVLLESLTRVGQAQMALIDTRLGESLALIQLAELVGPQQRLTTSPATESTDDDAAEPADEVTP
ncbi:MAG: TolC family protein [Phycisphaera sp.]|nr:MAG: TolC family protein [Phycisphaera sp.]